MKQNHRMSEVRPSQIPDRLAEPAMDAGQPPDGQAGEVIGYKFGDRVYPPPAVVIVKRGREAAMTAPQPTVWLVLQPHGILGTYTDEDEAREIAKATGNLLTHLPVDGDYRQR